MQAIGLEAIVSYLPERIVKREELWYLDQVIPQGKEQVFRGPDEFRRLLDDDAVDVMGEHVARKVLDHAGLTPVDIDYIVTSEIGGSGLPGGPWLHHRLGFPLETTVMPITDASASFINGLNYAWNLVLSGMYQRVLVITATAWDLRGEGVLDPTDPLYKLGGDGACAAIVSSQHLKCEFLSYTSRTDGNVYEHMGCTLGPRANPQLSSLTRFGSSQVKMGNYLRIDEQGYEWLQMDGRRIAIEEIERAMKRADLQLSDLDMVLYNQLGTLSDSWMEGAEERGVARTLWKDTYNKYGVLGNSTIGVNLAELSERGEIVNNATLALFTMAEGGQVPSLIIRWKG